MKRTSSYQPFQHPALKLFFTRFPHPWVTIAIYVPAGIALVLWSLYLETRSWQSALLWITLGVFAWTLVEYLLHRFSFHRTRGGEPWKTFHSGLHLAHHRDVEAQDLILAPPFIGFLLGPAEVLFFSVLSGGLARGLLMEVGLFLGYFLYEWVHYSAHFGPARGPLMKFWKAHHLRHHFQDPHGNFGVTTPLWDWVFRTRVQP
ncbi:MAG: sterol desaturase family protein [Deltaproteobacteria bacterium]|nr:sterol desaturase family protein [Deltaproteobacteria bacterium]